MFELKPLPPDRIAEALDRAQRYRLLNEPDNAESICLDVLQVEPEHQEALVLLLLSRTDLFNRGIPHSVTRAREVLPKLKSDYARAYYHGIICERKGKYLLTQRGQRSGFVAYDWFRHAMEQYEIAAELDSTSHDPILRWNTCARLIDRNPHCIPEPADQEEHGLE